MFTLSLKIDWVPDSVNKELRSHFQKRQRTNTAWDNYMWAQTNGKRPKEPLKRAKITIVRHAYRMLDYDGLVGSLKPVVDALVSCGVLIDDRWSVTGKWDVDQQYRPRKDRPMLEISIQELPE